MWYAYLPMPHISRTLYHRPYAEQLDWYGLALMMVAFLHLRVTLFAVFFSPFSLMWFFNQNRVWCHILTLKLVLFFILSEGVQPISWATRMHIARDVARGLSFLHSLDANVIYRDLKASNILLDSVCWHIKSSDLIFSTSSRDVLLNIHLIYWLIVPHCCHINLCRITTQSFQILAWQEMVQLVITPTFQPELLELEVMQPLNM